MMTTKSLSTKSAYIRVKLEAGKAKHKGHARAVMWMRRCGGGELVGAQTTLAHSLARDPCMYCLLWSVPDPHAHTQCTQRHRYHQLFYPRRTDILTHHTSCPVSHDQDRRRSSGQTHPCAHLQHAHHFTWRAAAPQRLRSTGAPPEQTRWHLQEPHDRRR